jgi:hypothetical protein
LSGQEADHPYLQPANRQNGQPAIDKSLETLRTLMQVKPDVPALQEQERSSRVRFPGKTASRWTMSTKRAGAGPGNRPMRDDDDDVRAWIVIGLIAFACLLVGWLPMLSSIGT